MEQFALLRRRHESDSVRRACESPRASESVRECVDAHHTQCVRACVRACGCLLFCLPVDC
eukprot:6190251-Pleurochrysis_carterae.AAC.1